MVIVSSLFMGRRKCYPTPRYEARPAARLPLFLCAIAQHGDRTLGREKVIRMLISGRVQGVFFRAYTRDEARRLGLRGWVRNLPDGRVEVLAQGDPDKLRSLESFCRQGPPYARVQHVEVIEETSQGEALPPFEITY